MTNQTKPPSVDFTRKKSASSQLSQVPEVIISDDSASQETKQLDRREGFYSSISNTKMTEEVTVGLCVRPISAGPPAIKLWGHLKLNILHPRSQMKMRLGRVWIERDFDRFLEVL